MSEEEEKKLFIVTDLPGCTVSDHLANVAQAEAEALLTSNEQGVRKFFQAKQCEEIGEALAMRGVTGSNLHILTNMDIENLGLRLGQQLSLKNFIFRLKYLAKSKQSVEEIWRADQCESDVEEEPVEGKCPLPEPPELLTDILSIPFCWCEPSDDGAHELPPATYVLTNTTLKLITSRWSDDWPDDETRHKTRREELLCFQGQLHPSPQYVIATDNIDLCAIEDIDHYVLSKQKVKTMPDIFGICNGYTDEIHVKPAEIVISYVDKGSDDGASSKKAILKVSQSQVEEVSGKIIAARDAALKLK